MSTFISRENTHKNYLGAIILGAAVVSLILSFAVAPRSAHAATLVGTSTEVSNNASTTLAKVGDLLTYTLTLNGTPVASGTPVIIVGTQPLRPMATTSLGTVSLSVWTFSTSTFSTGLTSGSAIPFSIQFNSDSTGVAISTSTISDTTVTANNAKGPNIVFDSVAPTLTNVKITSNNTTSSTTATVGNTIIVTASSSEAISPPVITIDGKTATVTPVPGAPGAASTSWQGSYTLVNGDVNGQAPFSITFADFAGNAGTSIVAQTTTAGSPAGVLISGVPPVSTPPPVSSGGGGGGIVGSGPLAVGFVVGGGVPGNYSGSGVPTTPTTTYGHPVNGMTENQVQSILSLLTSFGADATIINNVNASLHGVSTGGSTAPSFTFTRNLTMGSSGSDVKALQMYLNTHGYPLASSGIGSPGQESSTFGSLTRAALARFQAGMGISPAVGYFGPITRARINGGGTTIPNTTTTTTTTITPPPTPSTILPTPTPTPTTTTTSTTTTTIY